MTYGPETLLDSDLEGLEFMASKLDENVVFLGGSTRDAMAIHRNRSFRK